MRGPRRAAGITGGPATFLLKSRACMVGELRLNLAARRDVT